MSDRNLRFGFNSNCSSGINISGGQYHQNRCTLCLSEDDRNGGQTTCQHNTSVESALHYLRNYGAPISPPYGTSSYNGGSGLASTASAFGVGNNCSSPPVSPSYYTLAEFLLRINRMQQENGGGHRVRPPPVLSRPKLKSDMGCLRECAFCKSNGETAEFYKSHFLKDPVGRVRCPILQRYVDRNDYNIVFCFYKILRKLFI